MSATPQPLGGHVVIGGKKFGGMSPVITDVNWHYPPARNDGWGEPQCRLGFHIGDNGYWGNPLRPPLQRYYVLFTALYTYLGRADRWDHIVTVDASTPATALRKAKSLMAGKGRLEGYPVPGPVEGYPVPGPDPIGWVTRQKLLPIARLHGELTHDMVASLLKVGHL